jgi:NAD(P)H-flavin reductase
MQIVPQVWYVVSKSPEGWPYTTGYITEALMREKLFPAAQDTLGLMCGPPGLLDNVCKPGLTAMGYEKEHQISF